MRRISIQTFSRILLSLLILMLMVLCISNCNAQVNKKPIAYPDTTFGKEINVLANDVDINGDVLTVTKFNGKAFKDAEMITKKDTGTFTLISNGLLITNFDKSFTGKVKLTYYVNDGKGSSAAQQTGTIIVIKKAPYIGQKILRCEYNDSCKTDSIKNWVTFIDDGQLFYGYPQFYKAKPGDSHPSFEGKCYWLFFTNGKERGNPDRRTGYAALFPEEFQFILDNACAGL